MWCQYRPSAAFQLDVLADVLIREAILEGVRDELPHSIAVVVEEMTPRECRDDLIDVHAVMYVERQSQKAMVLRSHVYLDLRIKIAKDWHRDPRQLRRLGFYD